MALNRFPGDGQLQADSSRSGRARFRTVQSDTGHLAAIGVDGKCSTGSGNLTRAPPMALDYFWVSSCSSELATRKLLYQRLTLKIRIAALKLNTMPNTYRK